jgi:hypothetical protein
VTTQNEYLSIAGFEAYTGDMPASTTTSTTSSIYNVPANTKCEINEGSAQQSTNHDNKNSFPASNAFAGNKFTHTRPGVGEWWEV